MLPHQRNKRSLTLRCFKLVAMLLVIGALTPATARAAAGFASVSWNPHQLKVGAPCLFSVETAAAPSSSAQTRNSCASDVLSSDLLDPGLLSFLMPPRIALPRVDDLIYVSEGCHYSSPPGLLDALLRQAHRDSTSRWRSNSRHRRGSGGIQEHLLVSTFHQGWRAMSLHGRDAPPPRACKGSGRDAIWSFSPTVSGACGTGSREWMSKPLRAPISWSLRPPCRTAGCCEPCRRSRSGHPRTRR